MPVHISESSESAATWAARPFVSAELRDSVLQADIVMVPAEGYGDRNDLVFFPIGSERLFRAVRDSVTASGLHAEVAMADADYREVARYAAVEYIAAFVVTAIAAPVLVNIISDYILRKIGNKGEDATVKTSLTVNDERSGRSLDFKYEGPASIFKDEMLKAFRETQLLPGRDEKDAKRIEPTEPKDDDSHP